MEDLKEKIVGLLSLLGGARDLPFLAMAFAGVPRGDIAIAVLELCSAGKLVADGVGIHLAEDAGEGSGKEPASAGEPEREEPASAEESEQEEPASAAESERESIDAEAAALGDVPADELAGFAGLDEGSAEFTVSVKPIELSETREEETEPNQEEPVAVSDEKSTTVLAEASPESVMSIGQNDLIGLNGDPVFTEDDYLSDDEIDALVAKLNNTASTGAGRRSAAGSQIGEKVGFEPKDELIGGDVGHTRADVGGADVFEENSSASELMLAQLSWESLPFSNRARNTLRALSLETVAEVVARLDTLADTPRLGLGTAQEIRTKVGGAAKKIDGDYLPSTAVQALCQISQSADFVFDETGLLCVAPQEHREAASVGGASSGDLISNLSLSSLSLHLSEPVIRRLCMNGVTTVGDVVQRGIEGIMKFPYVGTSFAEEVKNAIESYCRREGIESPLREKGPTDRFDRESFLAQKSPEVVKAVCIAEDLCLQCDYPVFAPSFAVIASCYAEEALARGNCSSSDMAQAIFERIEKNPVLMKLCEAHLRTVCSKLSRTHGVADASASVPQGAVWAEAAKALSAESDRVEFNEVGSTLTVHAFSLAQWLDSQKSRGCELLCERLSGLTLQEVADRKNLTRERVRQLTEKALQGRPPLQEDTLLPFFEKYDMTEPQFCAVTGGSSEAYRYLSLISSNRRSNRLSLIEALDDAGVPDEFKRAIKDGGVVDTIVFADGETLPRSKQAIVEHLLRKYAFGQSLTLERVLSLYEDFLGQHSLSDVPTLQANGTRAFGACIDRYERVMYARVVADENGERKGVRYYDSTVCDVSRLVDTVRTLVSRNMECSTALLMRMPEIQGAIANLDVRNEYELHWLLSRRCQNIEGFECGRVPMVTLGEADRRSQILQVVADIGPASIDDIAREYESRYGVRRTTFLGNYASELVQYECNGMYLLEESALTQEQSAVLSEILSNVRDYCVAKDVEREFGSHFSEWSGSLFSDSSLKKAGFRMHGALLVRQDVDERKVFADMIASHARFTLGLDSFLPEVVASDSFKAELRRAERAFSVVEVRKDEYWGSSNFEKLGNPLTPDDFRAYLSKVIDWAQPRRPFTVASLRRAGLTRPLDDAAREAGLGDYFIESVLSIGYVGGRLKRTSMAGATVFCVMPGTFDAPGMLGMLMGNERSMSVGEMVRVLNDDLGIRTIPAVVKQLVRRSSALQLDDATGSIVREAAGGAREDTADGDAEADAYAATGGVGFARGGADAGDREGW